MDVGTERFFVICWLGEDAVGTFTLENMYGGGTLYTRGNFLRYVG